MINATQARKHSNDNLWCRVQEHVAGIEQYILRATKAGKFSIRWTTTEEIEIVQMCVSHLKDLGYTVEPVEGGTSKVIENDENSKIMRTYIICWLTGS